MSGTPKYTNVKRQGPVGGNPKIQRELYTILATLFPGLRPPPAPAPTLNATRDW